MNPLLGAVAVGAVILLTLLLGGYGLRLSRTTSDFLVASRTVSPLGNAAAIGGEYLSAASFLGIAGLVMAYGVDMLWYPIGYTAGYLVLLLLVAAPLRRSGAYTLPDFAESRLGSAATRRVTSLVVVVIGWLYLLPQLQGAGLTLQTVTGAPSWAGAAVVAVVVTGSVAAGGMRSITLVQAVQYWLKLTALAVPAVVLLTVWHAHGAPALTAPGLPHVRKATTVELRETVRVTVPVPTTVDAHGTVDGVARDAAVALTPGDHLLAAGTQVRLRAGSAVPQLAGRTTVDGSSWAVPLHGDRTGHPLYATYSLVLATFLGTMGLPHVLARFYTNPDGRAARRTTLLVLVLLGAFYLVPPALGALGRHYVPQLLLTGRTDAAVLVLPSTLLPGLPGLLLGALVTAGAFAAFLSTSSGLVVSVAGVLVRDVLRRPVRDLRRATVIAGLVPLVLSLAASRLPVTQVVGLAFGVAAATFCPLLVLGIWWRGLTDAGALAGLTLGGLAAASAVVLTVLGREGSGWTAALLAQPAAWAVPLSFAVMVTVSLATRGRVPADVGRRMLAMHLPERPTGALPGRSSRATDRSAHAPVRRALVPAGLLPVRRSNL